MTATKTPRVQIVQRGEQVELPAPDPAAIPVEHQIKLRELTEHMNEVVRANKANKTVEGWNPPGTPAGHNSQTVHPSLSRMMQNSTAVPHGISDMSGLHPNIARMYAAITDMAPEAQVELQRLQALAASARQEQQANAENEAHGVQPGQPTHPSMMWLGGVRNVAVEPPKATNIHYGPKRLEPELKRNEKKPIPGYVRDMSGNPLSLVTLGDLIIVPGPMIVGNDIHNLVAVTENGQRVIAQSVNDVEALENYRDSIAYESAVAKGDILENSEEVDASS